MTNPKVRIAFYNAFSPPAKHGAISGTERALFITAVQLSQNPALDIVMYSGSAAPPSPLHSICCQSANYDDLPQVAKRDGIDILTLVYNPAHIKTGLLDKLQKAGIKTIVWAHNFILPQALDCLAGNRNVERIVCACNEMREMYRDHPAFAKSVTICNPFDAGIVPPSIPSRAARPKEVTYLGALIPSKGFHVLAQAWKAILKAEPDAILNVIGGNLYRSDVRLGQYGLAGEKYERLFMRYLTDKHGNILPSVKFHCLLGDEKDAILLRTKAGVPNPTGITEVCSYVSMELQAFGAKVCACRCRGYMETIMPQGNILFRSPSALAKSVVRLLRDNGDNHPEVMAFLQRKFAPQTIGAQWEGVIADIMAGRAAPLLPIVGSKLYRFKWLKECSRRLKSILPFGRRIPSLIFTDTLRDHLFYMRWVRWFQFKHWIMGG